MLIDQNKVSFTPQGMEVVITSSKIDQYRQGQMVPIAVSGKATCPVAMLRKYIIMDYIDPSFKERLFCPISTGKKKVVLRKTSTLRYTHMRELVLEKLEQLGYDKKQFGLHSF